MLAQSHSLVSFQYDFNDNADDNGYNDDDDDDGDDNDTSDDGQGDDNDTSDDDDNNNENVGEQARLKKPGFNGERFLDKIPSPRFS